MNALEITDLVRHFPGNRQPAVDSVSFALQSGEILALVGPSGCGKTTLLRLIAGLERPDAGTIRIHGRVIAAESVFVKPEQRGVGMVFQDLALFPHKTVFENVAFGVMRHLPGQETWQKPARKRERVMDLLKLVGLTDLAGRYPHALSGGERQRVALARALAPNPVLVLMDEPFSSLDADLRVEVREQVRGILKAMRATVIFVTHEQEEALYMGDRLAVIQDGRFLQMGTPEEIFHASATRFVAEFMGHGDFLKGNVVPEGILTEIGLQCQPVHLPVHSPVDVAVRADDVDFLPHEAGNGVIQERFFRGAFYLYRLRLDSGPILHALKPHVEQVSPGVRVQVFLSAGHPLVIFPDGTRQPNPPAPLP